jgi:hypothetical protein
VSALRPLARTVAQIAFWLLTVPTALWILHSIEFLVVMPKHLQTELFGRPLAGPLALRAASDDCCLLPLGDGYREWTYRLPDALARRLAATCARPPALAAGRVGSRDLQTGYCIVRRRDFGPNGVDGSLTASVSGGRLRIAISWT